MLLFPSVTARDCLYFLCSASPSAILRRNAAGIADMGKSRRIRAESQHHYVGQRAHPALGARLSCRHTGRVGLVGHSLTVLLLADVGWGVMGAS